MTQNEKTRPEVFIIESLNFDEEDTHREGEVVYRTLTMSEKRPIYQYIRTRQELDHFLDEFDDSGYRYLHISAHGSKTHLHLTCDAIPWDDFAATLAPIMDRKRLFLSTCWGRNRKFAEKLIKNSSCFSISGPEGEIDFDDSAVFWSSFYHLMFKKDALRMKHRAMREHLGNCSKMLDTKMGCFYREGRSGVVEENYPA